MVQRLVYRTSDMNVLGLRCCNEKWIFILISDRSVYEENSQNFKPLLLLFQAYKGLEAYNQAYNGWVTSVKWYRPDNCSLVVLTAKVLHSQKLSAPPLTPWVIADTNGAIVSTHCKCMAGLAETCTHVAAHLFFTETAVRFNEKVSITGQAAYWVPPSGLNKVGAKRACDIDFTSSSTQRRRIEDDDTPSKRAKKSTPIILSKEAQNCFLKKLADSAAANKPAAILSVLPEHQHLFQPQCSSLPRPLMGYKNDSFFGQSLSFIKDYCSKIDFSISIDEAKAVEEKTREQSKSRLWFRQREGRITASELYSVCHTSIDRPSLSLLQRLVSSPPRPLSTNAVQWGITNEKAAKEYYIKVVSSQHNNFCFNDCELFISVQYPFLAATHQMVC